MRPQAEGLETRALMTGGGGNTFALIAGKVETANTPAQVRFLVEANKFQLTPRGAVIGFDVASAQTSNLQPQITAVRGPGITPKSVQSVPNSDVVLAKLPEVRSKKGVTYEVMITSTTQKTGEFLVGFYLPGDANGDGVVSRADIKAVQKSLNLQVGDRNYEFNADANRDGKITKADLKIAQRNIGARTRVLPLVTANLDPLTDSGPADRKTGIQQVRFTGESTPGAKLTFTEINGKAPEVKLESKPNGTYVAVVTLGEGDNVFKLEATDSFGQTMAGQLAKVTYDPALANTPPDALASTTPASPTAQANANKAR
jgi:flagellar basal body rod protein FlgC